MGDCADADARSAAVNAECCGDADCSSGAPDTCDSCDAACARLLLPFVEDCLGLGFGHRLAQSSPFDAIIAECRAVTPETTMDGIVQCRRPYETLLPTTRRA